MTLTFQPGADIAISEQTARRLQQRIDELHLERVSAIRLAEDASGDSADQAMLALRDMEIERVDAELARLVGLLAGARVTSESERAATPADSVVPGVEVRLRFAGDSSDERYLVGTLVEQDDDVTVVTPSSPLGQALLGARVGDRVTYVAPGGPAEVTVTGIG